MIQVCDLSFANSSITDTLGNYSLVSSGTVTISSHTYPANTDPILYVTDSSYSCIEFGQTATYSNGAIVQAGVPTYGSKNWSVEFRARVTGAMPGYSGYYEIFYGFRAPYDDNGTPGMGGHWSIAINNDLDALEFGYEDHYDYLTIKDNLDFTSWHLYKVTKTVEEIITLHIDGVLVATIDFEQLIGHESYAVLGSFALLGAVEEFPTASHLQTNQAARLADVKVYADPMGHAEKAISLDNLSRVFRNYNTWLGAQLSGQIGDGTLTIKVNGTNVATFTANQSTAATANITVPTAVSELANDSGYLTASSNLDASKLTSGTVDIARLPQGALERLVKVANEAARYALTTADVQLGDTVQQLDTGIMYVVTDTDHLDSAAGYTEYTAGTAASVPWSGVTGKPTFAAVATSGAYSDLTGTPTIPTVNNATLTIQRNGTTVDTFTANASVDKTINISTADDTKIPLTGSNAISGSLIPATDNSIDIGSSTKNIKALYTKGITINGTQSGSGGAVMTGNSLGRTVDYDTLKICGSVDSTDGGFITVCGKNYANFEGRVFITANDGTRLNQIEIRPNGDIKLVDCAVFYTGIDNHATLGSSAFRWSVVYAATGTINTSDSRLKNSIKDIDDALLDAWENVEPKQYKFNDATEKKGEKARYHTGYLAQDIQAECEKHGVNASDYGLFCHDSWEEQEEKKDENGQVIEPYRANGDLYSLRYEEALVVECKYLRRCIARLTARIEELEKGKEQEASK